MKIGLRILSGGDKVPIQVIASRRFRLRSLLQLVILTLLVSSNSYAKQEENTSKPIFKLVKGQGTEVCEAYLERLNKTEFLDNDPIKGRLIEPLLKGFIELKSIPLTAEEIQSINYKTISFDRYQDQSLIDKFSNKWDEIMSKNNKPMIGKAALIARFPENSLEAIKKDMADKQKTPFVRYQVQLDLDNDGTAGDIVIKNNNSVYIVDLQLKQINEDRMKRLFANQEALDWPTQYQFPALAFPITVFGYNNKYYFDGFFNNLYFEQNRPVNIAHHLNVPYLLGVFINEREQTQRICEYEWVNGSHKY